MNRLSCLDKEHLGLEIDSLKCDPCIWNGELANLLDELDAEALKQIPEEYAQERFGVSRDELDYTHLEAMCDGVELSPHWFAAFVILQKIDVLVALEGLDYTPCESPTSMEEEE